MTAARIDVATDPTSCRLVEDIQREAWGMTDRALVPAEQIRAIVHNGGLLLVATVDDAPVGFCYGFVGLDGREPILCSHMLAVRPGVQSQGIGRALKLAQQRHAAARGFAKITWTFDPLQARNAHLNLRRLGAFARRYHIDHYGAMDDAINQGMPTDRLLAEWPVTAQPRTVREDPRDIAWLLAPSAEDPARPAAVAAAATSDDAALVAVPAQVDALRDTDPSGVAAWRTAVREALTAAFAADLVAVDLLRDIHPGYSAYLLERSP